jgi:hypothetical protein
MADRRAGAQGTLARHPLERQSKPWKESDPDRDLMSSIAKMIVIQLIGLYPSSLES